VEEFEVATGDKEMFFPVPRFDLSGAPDIPKA
jgi:hypothetical protein